MPLNKQRAINLVEFDDIRQEVYDAFQEFDNTLRVLVFGPGTTTDPDYGHYTNVVTQVFELHYSNVLSTSLKASSIEDADFATIPHNRAYVSTLEVERVIPGGKMLREAHIIEINGVQWQIQAIVPYPMQHSKSAIIKLHLTHRVPAEQNQGSDGI